MDIEKCRALLETLSSGSLSATAKKLGYTPSGISRMMASLEDEFGFTLLLRVRNGIRPTKECERLLPQIKQLVEDSERLRLSAEEISGIVSGEIFVGTPYPTFYAPLFQTIAEFNRRYPKVQVKIMEGMSSDLCAAIEQNRLDFCIVSRRKGNFDWYPLQEDSLVALLAKEHPLAKQKSLPLSCLESEPFIVPHPGKETDVLNFLTDSGIQPNVRFSCQDINAAYYMVAAGLGITLDNAIFASRYRDAVCMLPLEPPQTISIGIATPPKPNMSPAARKFLALSKEFFQGE